MLRAYLNESYCVNIEVIFELIITIINSVSYFYNLKIDEYLIPQNIIIASDTGISETV